MLAKHHPQDLLEDYPLKPHELYATVRIGVFEQLVLIADRAPDTVAWIVDEDAPSSAVFSRTWSQRKKRRLMNSVG